MVVGFFVWAYTLFIPSFLEGSTAGVLFLQHGPFGIEALRPQDLLGTELPPLLHGTLWSLSLNILTYIVLSLMRAPSSIERLQADRLRAEYAGADHTGIPALADHSHGAGHPQHRDPISRPGPRAQNPSMLSPRVAVSISIRPHLRISNCCSTQNI